MPKKKPLPPEKVAERILPWLKRAAILQKRVDELQSKIVENVYSD